MLITTFADIAHQVIELCNFFAVRSSVTQLILVILLKLRETQRDALGLHSKIAFNIISSLCCDLQSSLLCVSTTIRINDTPRAE